MSIVETVKLASEAEFGTGDLLILTVAFNNKGFSVVVLSNEAEKILRGPHVAEIREIILASVKAVLDKICLQ